MSNTAVQTAVGPLVIDAVEQSENPRQAHDAGMPGSGIDRCVRAVKK